MNKKYHSLIACACLTALFFIGGAATIHAAVSDSSLNPVRIYGPITKDGNGRISIDNQAQTGYQGQIILNTSPESTRILDAVTGFPVPYDNLRTGETVYAYIGNAMTMSLPPMTSASMIFCNIPADFKVPDYVEISSISWNSAHTNAVLTARGEAQYSIAAATPIFPYLTRNIVTLNDLTPSRTCLIWSDASKQANKIMLFSDNIPVKSGWTKEAENWYYYTENENLHTGWLLDNGNWYYLNPNTGIMQTGFLTVDGKTYYLQENGSMLTTSKTFTPDQSGAIR